MPYGVNLLWDAAASVAVAVATGAVVRPRGLHRRLRQRHGTARARTTARSAGYRHAIGADDVAIFANITPEFSRSVGGRTVAERAASAAYMGVDALLISGPAAGVGASMDEISRGEGRPRRDVPVLANTGVNHETVERRPGGSPTAPIVGTSLKVDGYTWNPVDPAASPR